MQFSLKKAACAALGGKNIFTPTAVQRFLEENDNKYRQRWAESIQQPCKLCFYVTTLENDISKQRRACFRELREIQLKEFMQYVQDKDFAEYMRLAMCLFSGTPILDRNKVL